MGDYRAPERYEIPENDCPQPAVWNADGTFDSDRAAAIFEQCKGWPSEQRAAMLSSLRAAQTRAKVKTKYASPAEIARAVTPPVVIGGKLYPGYIITPALRLIAELIELVLKSPRKINLLITMPPQEGKSVLAAVWTVIRALQLNPNLAIALVTYAQALAESHSRTIREIIKTYGTDVVDGITGLPVEDKIGLKLARGANKVSAWSVEGGTGGFVGVGIGGPLTGRKADLLIIDDPFKNMMEADSATHRDKVHAWFSSVAWTRLSPSASTILIQCMTGDTPVLRPDGTETPLRDIRPGDRIATYEDGKIAESTVRNHADQGPDVILTICLKSGRKLRANARHPFLVTDGTTETWVRAGKLRPGQSLTAIENGPGRAASRGATPQRCARECAASTTGDSGGLTATAHRPATRTATESGTCGTATASTTPGTTHCSLPRTDGAPSAASCRCQGATCRSIGTASCASITTTTPEPCAACSATTATSCSSAVPVLPDFAPLPTTWNVTRDEVVSVAVTGVENVYDIQVDRTENFIANGVVSHNTRWHPEDLAGKILAGEKLLPPHERTWRHVNIPAIAEEGIPDALDRPFGQAMISARDTPEARRNFPQQRKQVGERTWYALYQGSPKNPAGGLFLRSWFDTRVDAIPSFPLASVVGVDPADTGEGDEAGVIAGMLTSSGRVVLTHDRSGHYTSDKWARVAVTLALEMGAREIAVEGYTSAKTYIQTVKRAYTAIHLEAVEKNKAGAALTPVEQRALPMDLPPFMVTQWRAPSKLDAVARSALIRQAFETGKCVTVADRLAVFEEQASDWQEGQHQPDRVAAAVIVHDRLAALGGGGMRVTSPTTPRPTLPTEPPAWMRRSIG